MFAASGQGDWSLPAIVVIAIVFYIGLGWGILRLYRWYRRRAETALGRAYAGLTVHWPAVESEVTLCFHTYYGFFVWFTQVEHRVALPADQARDLCGGYVVAGASLGAVALGATPRIKTTKRPVEPPAE
jgi:hypothetical protein